MNNFNLKQLEAINTKKQNVITIAGAGSGKTSVFVERIKTILKNTKQDRILALTFTEKASEEFKERLDEDLKYFGTFHSVFYKILNLQQRNIGFKIFNENGYKFYLENTYKNKYNNKEFEYKIKSMNNLDKFINDNFSICLECKDIKEFYEKMNELLKNELGYTNEKVNIIEEFFKNKNIDKVLSFNDIILNMYFLVKEPIYLKSLGGRFEYILIDEFQDTNIIVLEIINMLKNENNNIFMVGDPYQSIYSFQGAKFERVLKLIEEYEIIQLETNYRSSENIVDFANTFINKNLTKIDNYKNINDSGLVENKSIKIVENISDYTIPKIINDLDDLNNTCIIARNNNHIKEVKELLNKWKIPYKYKSDNEVEYIIYSILLKITSEYQIESILNDKYFDRFNFKDNDFINEKEDILKILKNIQEIFNKYEIIKYLDNRNQDNFASSMFNIQIKILKIWKSKKYINVFLESMKNKLNFWLEEEKYISKNGVDIMTIHKSKGLEWNNVILYNFEDNIFPKIAQSEEEKRLYYVAITRPKKELYITSKNEINIYTKSIQDNKTYIEKIVTSKEIKNQINIENGYNDVINFNAEERELKFFEVSEKEYKEDYDNKNVSYIIKGFIKETNEIIQDKEVRNINDYSIVDIEEILLDLEELKNEAFNKDLDGDLAEMIEFMDTDRDNFFIAEEINYDYINNEFTPYIHNIINYIENEFVFDIDKKYIKKVKRICKYLISKKNTDITKDKSKKTLEISQRILDEKNLYKNVDNYDDFTNLMFEDYYKKSDKERKFFIHNVLGMYDTVNQRKMIDLTDDKYFDFKKEIALDLKLDSNNNYYFKEEVLKGNHINIRKKNLAYKRWSKVKYIEYDNILNDCSFITFTLSSKWHRWKTKAESLKEDRQYGDGSILIDNPNFIMQGNDLREHFINSAKEMNKIWTSFYHLIKISIQNKHGKKHKYAINFFKQLEAHKNISTHGHFLIFYAEEIKDIIKDCYEKTILKFELNKKFQDNQYIKKRKDTLQDREKINELFLEKIGIESKLKNKNYEVGEKKELKKRIKEIDKLLKNTVATPSSYVAKYIAKNAFGDTNKMNSKSTQFFNAWESMLGNKVRTSGASNYHTATQLGIEKIYKWYQENFKEMLEIWKNHSPKPLYWHLEQELVDGNFFFEYNREVKENFKNSDYMKDINLIFDFYKTKNLTFDKILENIVDNDRLKHLISDETNFNELLENRFEKDEVLFELAKNFILNVMNNKTYTNIYTDKKLISVYVSKKLEDSVNNYDKSLTALLKMVDKDIDINKREKENKKKVIQEFDKTTLNHLDIDLANIKPFIDEQLEVNKIVKELDNDSRLNLISLVETLKHSEVNELLEVNIKIGNQNNIDKDSDFFKLLDFTNEDIAEEIETYFFNNDAFIKIYEEDMYIKGYMSANQIMEFVLETHSLAHLELIKKYDNYIDNYKTSLIFNFTDKKPDILDIFQKLAIT